ncbi:MAG: rhodanese-like domain-containing protein [Leptospiraceae bacterium]|nr:rhodanese-like domain-containing protein [Leptospiraceae bacterium]
MIEFYEKFNKNIILKIFHRSWVALLVIGALFVLIASFVTNRDTPRVFAVDAAQINRSVEVNELADWYIQNKKDFEVLDLRSEDQYKTGHIQQAISCPVCHLNKQDANAKFEGGQEMPNFQKKIVIYTQTGNEPISLPRVLTNNTDLYVLAGGYEKWQDVILTEKTYSPEDTAEQIDQKKRANAVTNFFTGKTELAAPVQEFKKVIKRKHVISSGRNEGC